jgi:hypothetical protein
VLFGFQKPKPKAQTNTPYLSLDVSVAEPYGFYLGIEHLPCLIVIEVINDSKSATPSESKAAADVINNEAGAHPNHPNALIMVTRKVRPGPPVDNH